MATNQTEVTVSLDTTFSLPISYAPITMVAGVDHQEQLLLFRNDIQDAVGFQLTINEFRRLGQLSSSWLVLDEIEREILEINIPPATTFTKDNGDVISIPALTSGESLTVRRANVLSEPYVEWTTGSRITADQLNLNTRQLIGLIQELSDKLKTAVFREDFDALVTPAVQDLDMQLNKIINLGDPDDPTDAATKEYVDAAINTAVTSKLGMTNGIATLDPGGKLLTAQRPDPLGILPRSFFSQETAPLHTSGGQGLYGWGSLWFNTTNGRLYIYIPDSGAFPGQLETSEGNAGYWVDVSAPVV